MIMLMMMMMMTMMGKDDKRQTQREKQRQRQTEEGRIKRERKAILPVADFTTTFTRSLFCLIFCSSCFFFHHLFLFPLSLSPYLFLLLVFSICKASRLPTYRIKLYPASRYIFHNRLSLLMCILNKMVLICFYLQSSVTLRSMSNIPSTVVHRLDSVVIFAIQSEQHGL